MGALDSNHQAADAAAQAAAIGYVTRPGVVTFICIVNFIFLAIQILLSVLYAIAQYQPANVEYLVTVVFYAIIYGGLSAIIGGLWYAKNWARIAYVVVFPLMGGLELLALMEPSAFPMLILGILRMAFLVFLCVLLYRGKSSAYFRGEILPPIDLATGLENVAREIIRCPFCNKEIYSTAARCHHCGKELVF